MGRWLEHDAHRPGLHNKTGSGRYRKKTDINWEYRNPDTQ